HLGGQPRGPAGDGDEDRGRLVGEVEGAGDDEAVGRDDQAGGRASAAAQQCLLVEQLGAAGGVDLDDARGDAGGGGRRRLLLRRHGSRRLRRERSGENQEKRTANDSVHVILKSDQAGFGSDSPTNSTTNRHALMVRCDLANSPPTRSYIRPGFSSAST